MPASHPLVGGGNPPRHPPVGGGTRLRLSRSLSSLVAYGSSSCRRGCAAQALAAHGRYALAAHIHRGLSTLAAHIHPICAPSAWSVSLIFGARSAWPPLLCHSRDLHWGRRYFVLFTRIPLPRPRCRTGAGDSTFYGGAPPSLRVQGAGRILVAGPGSADSGLLEYWG